MVKYRINPLDSVFAALADPIRRGMLERLAQGEASAGELAEPHRVSLPAISRHLRVLEQAGLMTRRKTGRVHRCRINARPIREAAQWIEQYRQFWEQRFDALEQHLERTQKEEESAWPHPVPPPKRRSKSNARSKRPAKKSSGRGPNRKK